MSRVHIALEQRPDRPKRYVVRMRLGGRDFKLRHLGSFATKKEADACADWARMLLAQGRAPDRAAALAAQDPVGTPTVALAVTSWLASRIDLSPGSRKTYAALAKIITEQPIGKLLVTRVDPAAVQAFVGALVRRELARDTISSTRGILAGALDEAGVDPNPARHRSVKLPREDRQTIEPPSYDQIVAVLDRIGERYGAALATLEGTGLRVSEACSVRQVDVDRARGRVRVRKGKSKDATRFAPLPLELAAILPEGNPVLGVTPDGIRGALERACDAAKVPRFSPHDLRHRWAARQVQTGVPITQVAAWMGHSRPSMTLDVYAVVVVDTQEAWRHFVQLSNSARTDSTAARLT